MRWPSLAGAKEEEESSHGVRREERTQGDGGGVGMETQHSLRTVTGPEMAMGSGQRTDSCWFLPMGGRECKLKSQH